MISKIKYTFRIYIFINGISNHDFRRFILLVSFQKGFRNIIFALVYGYALYIPCRS